MISNAADPKIETPPDVSRLVQQAQSGDAAAFVQLYDAYVEPIYRYVYFQVINDAAAESITSQVFRQAWENLNTRQKNGSSFVAWILEIAKNRVTNYYETDLANHALDAHFLSVVAEFGLNQEVQDLTRLETMRNHLRFLTGETKQTVILRILNLGPGNRRIARLMAKLESDVHVLQVITLQTVAEFLDHLNLGRDIKPSPQFTKRTRFWLVQFTQFHTRRLPGPSLFSRMALTYTVLVTALVVTGTAKAQSAVPGDMLYGWKRTSEQAWVSVSPDPVGTNIILANRRLNEWLAVENDPERSRKASSDYFNALARLQPSGDAQSSARIITVLRAHSQRLNDAGISTVRLSEFLAVAANSIPSIASTQTSVTTSVQTDIHIPTVITSPAKEIPTQAAHPPTAVPTVFTQPTEVPTEVALPTEVPTEVALPTEVPTEVAPPTEVPTEVAPPATEAPTEAAPPATDVAPTSVPPPPTEAATEIPNPVVPTQEAEMVPTGTIP